LATGEAGREDRAEEGAEPRQPEPQRPPASTSLGGILRQLSNRGDAGGGQSSGQDSSETAAAAAERHRLTGTSILDYQAPPRRTRMLGSHSLESHSFAATNIVPHSPHTPMTSPCMHTPLFTHKS
jgi:hypothetical protein